MEPWWNDLTSDKNNIMDETYPRQGTDGTAKFSEYHKTLRCLFKYPEERRDESFWHPLGRDYGNHVNKTEGDVYEF